MAVVEVGLSVHDLRYLSEHVEITEHETSQGQPVFRGDLYRLDFAAVRVGYDVYKVLKNRKLIVGRQINGSVYLHGTRARIIPHYEEGYF